MVRLIDTNILVYRVDPRDRLKQQIAHDILRDGLADDSVALPHQAVIEFVAAASRPAGILMAIRCCRLPMPCLKRSR